MAIVDDEGFRDPDRTSIVVADKPFMGLLNTTKSWTEYNKTRAGSCWEDYGLTERGDYPQSGWTQQISITSGSTYSDWAADDPGAQRCTYTPIGAMRCANHTVGRVDGLHCASSEIETIPRRASRDDLHKT